MRNAATKNDTNVTSVISLKDLHTQLEKAATLEEVKAVGMKLNEHILSIYDKAENKGLLAEYDENGTKRPGLLETKIFSDMKEAVGALLKVEAYMKAAHPHTPILKRLNPFSRPKEETDPLLEQFEACISYTKSLINAASHIEGAFENASKQQEQTIEMKKVEVEQAAEQAKVDHYNKKAKIFTDEFVARITADVKKPDDPGFANEKGAAKRLASYFADIIMKQDQETIEILAGQVAKKVLKYFDNHDELMTEENIIKGFKEGALSTPGRFNPRSHNKDEKREANQLIEDVLKNPVPKAPTMRSKRLSNLKNEVLRLNEATDQEAEHARALIPAADTIMEQQRAVLILRNRALPGPEAQGKEEEEQTVSVIKDELSISVEDQRKDIQRSSRKFEQLQKRLSDFQHAFPEEHKRLSGRMEKASQMLKELEGTRHSIEKFGRSYSAISRHSSLGNIVDQDPYDEYRHYVNGKEQFYFTLVRFQETFTKQLKKTLKSSSDNHKHILEETAAQAAYVTAHILAALDKEPNEEQREKNIDAFAKTLGKQVGKTLKPQLQQHLSHAAMVDLKHLGKGKEIALAGKKTDLNAELKKGREWTESAWEKLAEWARIGGETIRQTLPELQKEAETSHELTVKAMEKAGKTLADLDKEYQEFIKDFNEKGLQRKEGPKATKESLLITIANLEEQLTGFAEKRQDVKESAESEKLKAQETALKASVKTASSLLENAIKTRKASDFVHEISLITDQAIFALQRLDLAAETALDQQGIEAELTRQKQRLEDVEKSDPLKGPHKSRIDQFAEDFAYELYDMAKGKIGFSKTLRKQIGTHEDNASTITIAPEVEKAAHAIALQYSAMFKMFPKAKDAEPKEVDVIRRSMVKSVIDHVDLAYKAWKKTGTSKTEDFTITAALIQSGVSQTDHSEQKTVTTAEGKHLNVMHLRKGLKDAITLYDPHVKETVQTKIESLKSRNEIAKETFADISGVIDRSLETQKNVSANLDKAIKETLEKEKASQMEIKPEAKDGAKAATKEASSHAKQVKLPLWKRIINKIASVFGKTPFKVKEAEHHPEVVAADIPEAKQEEGQQHKAQHSHMLTPSRTPSVKHQKNVKEPTIVAPLGLDDITRPDLKASVGFKSFFGKIFHRSHHGKEQGQEAAK